MFFCGQDHYSLNTVSTATKYQEVFVTIELANTDLFEKWFYLNFVSGERVVDLEPLWTTANEINVVVNIPLMYWPHKRCGVIMINFAGGGDVDGGERNCAPGLVASILNRNFIN